jgi:endo-1,4-beta-D-glucanase Y
LIKDENGINTKERDPDFPNNYIEHIKSNIGKVDVIFVSSHEVVRKALAENNIKTIIVYPGKELKEEWIRRFKQRGNNEGFINFISSNWDKFIEEIGNEDYGFLKEKLNENNSYLDMHFLYGCFDNSMGNLTCLWANG